MNEPDMLQQAIDALNSGDRNGAAHLLAQVVSEDPRDETAWLWLAACLDSPEKKRYCLQKALELNPNNEAARQDLARLETAPAVNNPAQADIDLPTAPAAPASAPAAPAAPAPTRSKPAQGGKLSRVQVTIIALLAVAIIAVLAVLVYIYLMSRTGLASWVGLVAGLAPLTGISG